MFCSLNVGCPVEIKKNISFRALRKIDICNFKREIRESPLSSLTSNCVDVLAGSYIMNIENIMLSNMEKCVVDIKIRMTNNMLKLNDDKSELFVLFQVDAFEGVKYKY